MSRWGVPAQLVLIVGMTCIVQARAQVPSGSAAAPATTPTTSPATTTTSPTTAPDEIVENPFFVAWAKYKPGTTVEFDLKTDAAGQQMTTHIVQRLVEVSPEKVVVDVEAHIEVPGIPNPPQPQKQTKTFLPRVPKSELLHAMLPPGAVGDPTDAGNEIVHAAGKDFTCTVTEFSGNDGSDDGKAKQWRSPQIPGGMVKLESASAVMKVDLVVTKVQEK
jgi:hypothetical protein